MAITSGLTTTFFLGELTAAWDFSATTTQVFKAALYTSSATLGPTTTAYTTTNEVANGNGYTTGGAILTISVNPTISGLVAYMNFSDATWTSTSFTARGALIYKFNGTTNPAIFVVDFGEDKTTNGANFVIQFPIPNAASAMIRAS